MIYIDDNLRLSRADSRNICIEELKQIKDRKTKTVSERWEQIAYFGRLEGALKFIINRNICKVVDTKTKLDNIIKAIEKVKKETLEILTPHSEELSKKVEEGTVKRGRKPKEKSTANS